MKALQEHHLKVPEDVSIIAYDNMDLCKYTTPKITSVDHLGENIAKGFTFLDRHHSRKERRGGRNRDSDSRKRECCHKKVKFSTK